MPDNKKGNSPINLKEVVDRMNIDKSKKKKKSNSEKMRDEALLTLKDVARDSLSTEEDILKLSGGLMNILDPSKVKLTDKNSDVHDSNQFKISGDLNANLNIERAINTAIQFKSNHITMYNTTGLYYKIQQANYNQFLEESLPILEQSAELFIDDVNNGTFRGSRYEVESKFKFYKQGEEITEPEERKYLLKFLAPTDYSDMVLDEKSFFDIDKESDYTAWKHGYSITRVIANKEIAKELYIRYYLKNKKLESIKNKPVEKKMIVAASDIINNESVDGILKKYNTHIYASKNGKSLVKFNEKLVSEPGLAIEAVTTYKDGDKMYVCTPFLEKELLNAGESFFEFVTRWCDNRLTEVHIGNPDDPHNTHFSISNSGYTEETMKEVASQITNLPKEESFALESINDSDLKLNLDEVALEDIYNLDFTSVTEDNKLKPVLESVRSFFGENEVIATETFADNVFFTNGNSDPTVASFSDNNINDKTGVNKSVEDYLNKEDINYKKLDRMFDMIKGESIEYLENNRMIPIITGSRLIGLYYIEYTHQDIQHYIGLRSFIGNPQGYTQNMELIDIYEEQQEETIGRLIFSDIIKPIVERNTNVKFLKNNEEILYTIKKLLDQNDISHAYNSTNFNQYNMYNLSKVIYIPAKDVIFKRNGTRGLGKSRFDMASTPATAAILADETQLAWYLTNGGGYTIVTVPKGMSMGHNEYGQGTVMDRFQELAMTRARLKDIQYNPYHDIELGRKFITLEKDMQDGIEPLKVDNIPTSDFHIPPEVIRRWIEIAGDIVGYNPASFSSQDGVVELATKLHEINNAKKLQVDEFRKFKTRAASQLATKLVRLRGGSSCKHIVVEWIPPSAESTNDVRRANMIKDSFDSYSQYLEFADKIFENNEKYASSGEKFKLELLKRVCGNDSILMSMESMLTEAFRLQNVDTATTIKEKGSKKKKDDEDEEDGGEE